MKEEYVTYFQAVKLKELGFKDKCNAYYWTEDKAFECTNSIVHKNSDTCQTVVMAPFLWQAQKWLREKHSLSVDPICNMVRQWNVNVCEIDKFGTAVYSKMNLDTYELALSAGIDAALELLTLNTK